MLLGRKRKYKLDHAPPRLLGDITQAIAIVPLSAETGEYNIHFITDKEFKITISDKELKIIVETYNKFNNNKRK